MNAIQMTCSGVSAKGASEFSRDAEDLLAGYAALAYFRDFQAKMRGDIVQLQYKEMLPQYSQLKKVGLDNRLPQYLKSFLDALV